MEIIYYTIAAIILYGISDYILNRIEIRMGKRLPNRSFVFLVIITVLALASFSAIRAIVDQSEPVQQTTNTQIKQTGKEAILPDATQAPPTAKVTKK
jgi:predicted PurR-regulated permease PerM